MRGQNCHAKGIGPTLRLRFLLGCPTGGMRLNSRDVPSARFATAEDFRSATCPQVAFFLIGRTDGPVRLFAIRRVGAAPGSGAVRQAEAAPQRGTTARGGFYGMCVDATWGQAALLFALAPRQASGAVCQAEAARERRYSRRVRFLSDVCGRDLGTGRSPICPRTPASPRCRASGRGSAAAQVQQPHVGFYTSA